MMKKLLVRLQNKNVILGVSSGVLMILVNTGVLTPVKVGHINEVINTFLSLGIGFGIISNPESHIKVGE